MHASRPGMQSTPRARMIQQQVMRPRAHRSGQRLIPHVAQVCQQLAQQGVADLAAYAQLLLWVDAVLIGYHCLGQHLGRLHASPGV